MVDDKIYIQKSIVYDIDAQSELLQEWEQKYCQLSRGRFIGSLSLVQTQSVSLFHEKTNQCLHESFSSPESKLTFGFPMASQGETYINGRQITPNSFFIVEGGKCYDLRTHGNTELFGLTFDREFFFSRAEEKDMSIANQGFANKVINIKPALAPFLQRFFEMLRETLQQSENKWPETMSPNVVAETAFNAVWFALFFIEKNKAGSVPPPRSIDRQVQAVQQAVRYMNANLENDFSMSDVCSATHVSQRTLQYYFENCLHTSPQHYLKALRLNTARRLILRASTQRYARDRTPTIADIAAACGIEHPSRFAGEFKRQFGELPSEAAKRVADHVLARFQESL